MTRYQGHPTDHFGKFGRPLIPSDFLKRILTPNFHDMRNLMSVVNDIIIWLCLTRTRNYRIHEFDWLKRILTAV